MVFTLVVPGHRMSRAIQEVRLPNIQIKALVLNEIGSDHRAKLLLSPRRHSMEVLRGEWYGLEHHHAGMDYWSRQQCMSMVEAA